MEKLRNDLELVQYTNSHPQGHIRNRTSIDKVTFNLCHLQVSNSPLYRPKGNNLFISTEAIIYSPRQMAFNIFPLQILFISQLAQDICL